jgi:hypothetical protein
MPGSSIHSTTFDAVQVLSRKGIDCSGALDVAARTRWLGGVKVIYGPQFGGGGWGGPFHVGRWLCHVLIAVAISWDLLQVPWVVSPAG